jgi:hypothetical protein
VLIHEVLTGFVRLNKGELEEHRARKLEEENAAIQEAEAKHREAVQVGRAAGS